MIPAQEMVEEVFSEALEGFALLFTDLPEGEGTFDADTPYICSTIMIRHKTESVRLTIGAPEPLCFEMAANITGSDEDEILPDLAIDALNELSNITAGSWAARYFGEKEVCVLETPNSTRLTASEMQDLRARETLRFFLVEDYSVVAGVCFDSEEG